MGNIQFQFHVHPNELLDWIEEWTSMFGLHIATISYQPMYKARAVADVKAILRELRSNIYPDELWLSRSPFAFSATTKSATENANKYSLFIAFPQLSSAGLRESVVGAEDGTNEDAKLWRRLVKSIKGKCERGLWVVNPRLKLKKYYKTAYFTKGACAASRAGLLLLPVAGGNIMAVDEPHF
jgi:hypothetical protein